MKKIMFVVLTLLMLVASFAGAQTEDCVDCCEGDVCGPEEGNSATLDVYSCEVEVNGDEVYPDDAYPEVVERGEEMDIRVRLHAMQDMEDVQVTAMLTGYQRREQLIDMTRAFDLKAGDRETVKLALTIPDDWDVEKGEDDIVMLRILVTDDSHNTYDEVYKLRIEPTAHNVVIQDIVTDPADKVEAGRGMFVSVRVKNMGEGDEESIKVTASIPALDLKATEYIDELEEDEATTSEDMFLRIPTCAEPGEYVVKATVEYDYGDEVVSKQTVVEITAGDGCDLVKPGSDNDRTVVTVPGKQDVVKGTTGTVYPLIIENKGATDRAYELVASGLDSWATYRFDPGTYVLVKAGEIKTVYLYVTPKEDAVAGEKVFMVSVETSGDEKQIALSANVVEGDTDESPFSGDWSGMKNGLEVALIVLVVLLVILGLIVGFNKLKGSEDEPEEISGQTYY